MFSPFVSCSGSDLYRPFPDWHKSNGVNSKFILSSCLCFALPGFGIQIPDLESRHNVVTVFLPGKVPWQTAGQQTA